MTTLYYAQFTGQLASDPARDGSIPPDGDYYHDDAGNELPVAGVRLTRSPDAWDLSGEGKDWGIMAIDVPLSETELAQCRISWDIEHESFDVPESIVNESPRRWVQGAPTYLHEPRVDARTQIDVMRADRELRRSGLGTMYNKDGSYNASDNATE